MSETHKVPGTNLSFTRNSFSGCEYREFTRANMKYKYLDEVVENSFEFCIDALYRDGKSETRDPMTFDWFEETLPLYYAVSDSLLPKARSGSIMDESSDQP